MQRRRTIHFSDGVIELTSDDENPIQEPSKETRRKTLLDKVDRIGAKISKLIGLTRPRYWDIAGSTLYEGMERKLNKPQEQLEKHFHQVSVNDAINNLFKELSTPETISETQPPEEGPPRNEQLDKHFDQLSIHDAVNNLSKECSTPKKISETKLPEEALPEKEQLELHFYRVSIHEAINNLSKEFSTSKTILELQPPEDALPKSSELGSNENHCSMNNGLVNQ
ncbi:hypothetical protein Ciccas_001124 [Cichlidogyrus casuarinus]|uniref:Uncharacterized protein n=1 Tax=Cichlidogyrus casuarinus TaxID=1844966 RepID=A0ABD2QL98_9PLAT